uniref:NrsF family protein n=1 Tax=uncultured Sphingomonas sp. TaxID=158754 RepID=UPI0035CC993D
MSPDSLILELSADLAPVRRRHMLREAGLVLALGATELVLFLGLGAMRPDMADMAASPYLMWRVGSLAVLAGIACTVALRSFSPTAHPRNGVMLACALAILAMIGGMAVAPTGVSGHTLLERIDPARGILCAGSIFVLSLPVVAMLGVLMRRAAPTQPKLSAIASGIAAGTVGALVFAFCCPFNDPLYVVVWYSVGCAAVAGAARWRLPRRFRL